MYEVEFHRRILVGYYQGLRVWIEVELVRIDGKLRLTVSGDVDQKRRRGWVTILTGQIYDWIKERARDIELVGIDRATLMVLLDVWNRWHLNDLRPYCKHQEPLVMELRSKGINPIDVVDDYPELSRCPVCGYRYGTKWLYEPLPEQVIDFIKRL